MCLMEGKLAEIGGRGFIRTVQKTVLAKQAEQPDFIPTHICVSLDEIDDLPPLVEVLLANQQRAILPVYGWKSTRPGCVQVFRPEAEPVLA